MKIEREAISLRHKAEGFANYRDYRSYKCLDEIKEQINYIIYLDEKYKEISGKRYLFL